VPISGMICLLPAGSLRALPIDKLRLERWKSSALDRYALILEPLDCYEVV
jgi:hypothetical protein